ncbi:class I SAM-dependent methyltransferase [Nodosilinea sp. E11]|uniref:class I SAM-dependent methyltransferase n=1 Tax=Nodosilinea sp. E11 TaxID=3037479 RepID=UPI0029344DF5|nr:class I SAM-dependent methyltransferase [Nodosilinea sp. E11]WOD40107.1 class I SAM-dependent methyltransferase [Nodosilinea sp. E11]
MNFEPKWNQYYQAVEGRPPRDTLLQALGFYAQATSLPPFAVDLGCGDGRDTAELLRQGWRVLAIDGEPEAIARLRQRSDIDRTGLETRVQRFETLTLPPDVSLINASFCLPFCPPEHFPRLWEEIVLALAPGGRFCGHLFGDQDSWAVYGDMNHHRRDQVDQLLAPFEVEWLEEENHPGRTALGEEKHWHIFNIVARKR